MVVINIRLVGEEKDHLFNFIELDPQIHVVDLMKRIEVVTKIPPNFQKIQFRGNRLPVVEHPIQTIQFGEELVVEHNSLPQWTALTDTAKMFAKSKDSHQKKMHFNLANDYITALIDSKFFVVYAGLNERYRRIHRTLYKHYERRPEEIQNILTGFFEKMFMEKNPILCFNEKEEGTRDGVICTIKFQNIIERYYVKTNHDAGRSGSPSRLELDIREFFIYRLLERLGVGAAVHFPTSAIGSKCLVYIASLEIPNFKTFHEIEQKEENLSKYVHPAIQILTLFSVLSIADRHSKNVGVNNDGSPYIIDFFLDKLGIRDLQNDFYAHVRGSNQINKRIDEYSFEKRVEIGVEFLKKIEFEKNIDGAIKYFMEKDKKMFDENELHFSLNKTDDLNQYVEVVKENDRRMMGEISGCPRYAYYILLTAYECVKKGIPFKLITDSMAAAAMKTYKIDAILVGADQVAQNGDTANKIGTYMLAVLANFHRIPFYVVTPSESINPRIKSGTSIKIEERPTNELIMFNGKSTAPEGTQVWNPAFDVTPGCLITGILTENGNIVPGQHSAGVLSLQSKIEG